MLATVEFYYIKIVSIVLRTNYGREGISISSYVIHTFFLSVCVAVAKK